MVRRISSVSGPQVPGGKRLHNREKTPGLKTPGKANFRDDEIFE